MKKTNIFAALIFAASFLFLTNSASAFSSQDAGTITGGIIGGVVGSQVFHGDAKIAGVLGGALIGGFIGGSIGKSMARNDRRTATRAATKNKVGQKTTWKHDNKEYTVTPTKEFTNDKGEDCKEAITTVTVDGKTDTATTIVCKHGNKWYVQK